nr:tRNA pseudouridine(38-40) synthase TruA [Chloroflexota bacterium]
MSMSEAQAIEPPTGANDQRHTPNSYHLMAIVEYDGTDYLGFQIQRRGRTVQGEIEHALAVVTQQRTRIVGAGRTDAGVHARGQVIHFTVSWGHSLADLHRALNAVLPADVAIVALREAPPGFHARYDARSREYVYTIYNGAVRSPLAARYAYHFGRPLDVQAMDHACACLVGTHDFLPFGWPPKGENSVRTVYRARCWREGDFVYVELEADAFLRAMMRRIVGNLLLVGIGDLSVEGFARLLSLRHRRTPAVAAPAHGLCLVRVNY